MFVFVLIDSREESSSSVASSLNDTVIITPGLVSGLCRLLGNLFVLAQQDTVISLQHDNIFNGIVK